MKYRKESDGFSIVILSECAPVFLHARWMRDRNLLTQDELPATGEIIDNKISKFSTKNNINFICDPNRVQISTSDISLSFRIIKLAKELLITGELKNVHAIGLNGEVTVSFYSQKDSIAFGNAYMPLIPWEKYLDTPRVRSWSIEDGEAVIDDKPKRTIFVQSVGSKEAAGGVSSLVNISVNNHYVIKSEQEAISKIDDAQSVFDVFTKLYDDLICSTNV